MKGFLAKRSAAGSIGELQGQIDRFVAYYNEVRPHRATGRRPPRAAFEARDKARSAGPKIRVGAGVRVRRDRINKAGNVTLRPIQREMGSAASRLRSVESPWASPTVRESSGVR